jgi:spore germination protein YaaH
MFFKKKDYITAVALGLIWSFILFAIVIKSTTTTTISQLLSPIAMTFQPLQPLKEAKQGKEIFGFLPNWNLNKADNIDYSALTTLAYFDLKATGDGEIMKDDSGYTMFKSRQATNIFKKAHANGTKVVATVTIMEGSEIERFLDNPDAQDNLVSETVNLVKNRGIDGVNLDLEYFGGAGSSYQPKFTRFVDQMTQQMHAAVPGSEVSVSLYASVVKSPRIYNLKDIADHSDKIFMMAYDFATVSTDYAMPTAPLYGHASGKFWYDVSTAVEDFLTEMPANKLVLGIPYYNLSLPVVQPEMKAATTSAYTGGAQTMTYAALKRVDESVAQDATQVINGWDEETKTAWKAYYIPGQGWTMNFIEDTRTLSAKYDFANAKGLAGVGFWALGNEGNDNNLWTLIKEKFGTKLADNDVINKIIKGEDNI